MVFQHILIKNRYLFQSGFLKKSGEDILSPLSPLATPMGLV